MVLNKGYCDIDYDKVTITANIDIFFVKAE